MSSPESIRGEPAMRRNDPEYAPPAAATQQAAHVEIDDSAALADYANFCRLTGSPEELLIDFGFNPRPVETTPQPVVVTQRVVTGWRTAKRLLHVLQQAVARHEAAFGVLETDVQKRVRRA